MSGVWLWCCGGGGGGGGVVVMVVGRGWISSRETKHLPEFGLVSSRETKPTRAFFGTRNCIDELQSSAAAARRRPKR